jgi:hypothetical protein
MMKSQILVGPLALVAAFVLAGCVNPPPRSTEADGSYCFNAGRVNSRNKTCTPVAVPSNGAEAKARQFIPVAGAAVLYVVRNRWGDSSHRLPVSIDGQTPVITVPGSVVRVVTTPGEHQLALEWEGKRVELKVTSVVNDVVFAEVEGKTWSWGSTFAWYAPDAERTRQRVRSAKLIADLDLRR